MVFTSAATFDYYYHYNYSHDTQVDKGWDLDISAALIRPGGERYAITGSAIHFQAVEGAEIIPLTPPHSNCDLSYDIAPGTERPQQQQQQQRRKSSRRHRSRKSQQQQQQQKPETSISTPLPVQKRDGLDDHDREVAHVRLRSFSLSTRISPSMSMGPESSGSNSGSNGGVVTAAAIAAEVCCDHRHHSEPCGSHQDTQPSATKNKQRLYKTELCRNWKKLDHCRYGDKCQYAHGLEDLRGVERHPKYKTQVCRTYYQTGTCPYGTRCTFRHLDEGSPCLLAPPSTSSSSSSSSSLEFNSNNSNNNNVLPTDAESLLPPGLLVDLDEPPAMSFPIRPRPSILLPCFPSNHPFLADSGVWNLPNRASTL